jgi:hypothetical protein
MTNPSKVNLTDEALTAGSQILVERFPELDIGVRPETYNKYVKELVDAVLRASRKARRKPCSPSRKQSQSRQQQPQDRAE